MRMANHEEIPDIKRLVGALVFGANRSVTAKDIRRCLQEVAEIEGGDTQLFTEVRLQDIEQAVADLRNDLERSRLGFSLAEVAGGLRYQTDPACGRWLRHMLSAGKPARLSLPALETLAIIAYRQPIGKSDIEGIRGVNVDHIIKTLLEVQLVRIAGRSELPGRPFLYGTTQLFLEHFGLKGLKDLGDMEPLLAAAREEEKAQNAKPESEPAYETPKPESGVVPDPATEEPPVPAPESAAPEARASE